MKSDESSESEGEKKKSGVQGLIEIENPNRAPKKQNVKVKNLDEASGSNANSAQPAPELSRREREELERQQKQAQYQKLHQQGKTDQARQDLGKVF